MLAVAAGRRSAAKAVPIESASSSDIEVSPKLFKNRDSGNSSPDMFIARLLSVDLWTYFPPDAQNIAFHRICERDISTCLDVQVCDYEAEIQESTCGPIQPLKGELLLVDIPEKCWQGTQDVKGTSIHPK